MAIDTTATPTAAEQDAEDVVSQAEQPADDGQRVYDVGPDGTVKDWRRPDPATNGEHSFSTTEVACRNGEAQLGDPVLIEGRRGTITQFVFVPARKRKGGGWNVVVSFEDGADPAEAELNPAEVDLLLDELPPRKSTPIAEQTTGYGVPTEASFGDDDVKPAPDLLQMAVKLIEETDDFAWAKTLTQRIAFYWKKKGGSTGGQPRLYTVRFATPEEKRTNGWRIVVRFSADVCRTLLLKPDVIEALVHESLCQVERDEHGNLRKLAPDFRGYSANVERFGALVPPVRQAADALSVQIEDVRNLRLDLDGADDDEDEDLGV